MKGAYESELEIHKSGDTSWITFIAKLLDSISSDHFLNTTDNVVTKGQMGTVAISQVSSTAVLHAVV